MCWRIVGKYLDSAYTTITQMGNRPSGSRIKLEDQEIKPATIQEILGIRSQIIWSLCVFSLFFSLCKCLILPYPLSTFVPVLGQNEWAGPALKLTCYKAYGKSAAEALENLSLLCEARGVPTPVNAGPYYYCGEIEIDFLTKSKMRRSPVWFAQQNNLHAASVFYTKL